MIGAVAGNERLDFQNKVCGSRSDSAHTCRNGRRRDNQVAQGALVSGRAAIVMVPDHSRGGCQNRHDQDNGNDDTPDSSPAKHDVNDVRNRACNTCPSLYLSEARVVDNRFPREAPDA